MSPACRLSLFAPDHSVTEFCPAEYCFYLVLAIFPNASGTVVYIHDVILNDNQCPFGLHLFLIYSLPLLFQPAYPLLTLCVDTPWILRVSRRFFLSWDYFSYFVRDELFFTSCTNSVDYYNTSLVSSPSELTVDVSVAAFKIGVKPPILVLIDCYLQIWWYTSKNNPFNLLRVLLFYTYLWH